MKPINNKLLGKVDKIIKLYKSGKTAREISKIYNVTAAAISWQFKKHNVDVRKNTFSDLARRRGKENHVKGDSHWAYHDIPIEELIEKYNNNTSAIILSQEYNVDPITICRKLKKAGVILRQPGFSKWQIGTDGHKVQSYYEYLVCEWLYSHNILHINQPSLPFGRNTRADFLVGDTFIEVLGLISSPIYKEKYRKKLDLYKVHNLKVIVIFPSHFRDNLSILEQLL